MMSLNAVISAESAARELFTAYQRGKISGVDILCTVSISKRDEQILFQTAGTAGRRQAQAHLLHRQAVRKALLALVSRMKRKRMWRRSR
jgi:hypothetical protein